MMNKNDGQRLKRNTKEEILEAAIDLFSEKGVSGVSIRDITKKVGINESSLYNHFKNKDELLNYIIEKFNDELGYASFPEEEIERQLVGTSPELFLQHHLLSLRERITPSIQKIWKIIYTEQFRDKRARDTVVKNIIAIPSAYYEKAFSLMIEKDLIKPMDPKLLSDEYNYALFAFSLERMLLQVDNEDVMPIINKMFAHIKFICDVIKIS